MIIHTSAIEGYEPPLPRKGILKYLVDPEKTGAKSFVMGFTSIEPGTGTVLAQHPEEEDADLAKALSDGKRPFVPRRFHLAKSVQDSKALNDVDGPVVVISGSGMATGGRVLHHLSHRLPDPRATVLFVGYQAAGTRGRLLKDGAKEIRIFGENVPVRATIMVSDPYSAHADQGEILRWLKGFDRPPRMTYIVHGEPEAARALREKIAGDLAWPATVAEAGATVPL